MGTDRYPDLPTREHMLGWLAKATPTDNAAAVLLDAYTARVIAEHRDAADTRCPAVDEPSGNRCIGELHHQYSHRDQKFHAWMG